MEELQERRRLQLKLILRRSRTACGGGRVVTYAPSAGAACRPLEQLLLLRGAGGWVGVASSKGAESPYAASMAARSRSRSLA